MKTYLDNAATTKVDSEVVKAMKPYFEEKYGNASSLHSFGSEAKKALEESRKKIADKINADPSEIIFVSSGTEADNLAITGIAKLKGKGHIITSKIEHPAVLETCKELEKNGFDVTYLNVDKDGFVKDFEKSIKSNTILVSIMHANNEIGTVQDIEKIGKICRSKNIIFHSDCVQSFTKEKIDVKKMSIDLASFSSHKIHGPKGIAALYIKEGIKLKKLMFGGHHEKSIRPGTENIPGIVGFAKAVQIANENDVERIKQMRDKLINGLLKIPDTRLNGDKEKRLCNNISISFRYVEGESMLLYLDEKGIAVSTGSACSSQSLEPSHVLISIGLPHEIAHGTIRYSLSKYTTEKEIEYTIKTTKEVIERLRRISPIKRR
ncbi:MAG: cysteine desulfurase family protein [Candidatus Nanoarchaeia archaeon]|nr:cysteine desulfurase family protein [Candidatus Nanoarchaeia archaeon]